MSLSKVSVMLSMALSASAVGTLGGGMNPCEQFVEMPTRCAQEPGCMVRDEWNCVPVPEPSAGLVFVQHPGGMPEDTMVRGIWMDRMHGGPDFNIGDNVFVNQLPEFLLDTHFHPIPLVERRGGLKFECPEKEVGVGACDFFVAVFTCAPCSDLVNGGLPQLLTVSNGWEARSCAPVMMRVDSDDEYKMTIFRVRVANGHFVESPRLLRDAHYVAVFSTQQETEFCPIPVRATGPFTAGKKCGDKCPFRFGGD